ncbi:cytochrome C biogenesis protein CcmH [Polynucleobacter wuianus]|uniref:Cytochrome c-type biogenesis protein n=1 Tax=Polynucleobacter wuianus TaxID=1743168 RepID=A0A191UGG3_9BURK|nr:MULTISPECIES: cytochrome c-type biogenesis protein [Polynucleobacter]ANJ00053.1 cytochrome C biogenesis protein CcmH [Polynucleobacter wuianus]MBU3552890.1 cytochrome c-type biogenesis protein CcmH [Polynucleobacter sp. MWH-Post4-6-1]
MKYFFLAIASSLCLHAAYANDAAPLADDPVTEQRLISISEEMRCLVCQNESLAGSRSDLANDLRREIRTLIKEGKSDDQIRSFMVERYGDFVLYRPPVKPITWLLWIGPFVILVIGIAFLLAYLRRRNTLTSNKTLTAEDNQKIDDLLNALGKNDRDGIHG